MCVLGSRANPVTATVGGHPHFQCGCLKDGCECNCFQMQHGNEKEKKSVLIAFNEQPATYLV